MTILCRADAAPAPPRTLSHTGPGVTRTGNGGHCEEAELWADAGHTAAKKWQVRKTKRNRKIMWGTFEGRIRHGARAKPVGVRPRRIFSVPDWQ